MGGGEPLLVAEVSKHRPRCRFGLAILTLMLYTVVFFKGSAYYLADPNRQWRGWCPPQPNKHQWPINKPQWRRLRLRRRRRPQQQQQPQRQRQRQRQRQQQQQQPTTTTTTTTTTPFMPMTSKPTLRRCPKLWNPFPLFLKKIYLIVERGAQKYLKTSGLI